MVSRLVLNLRSLSESTRHIKSRLRDMDFRQRFVASDLLTMTIGNLGEDIEHYQDTDPDARVMILRKTYFD